MSSFKHAGQKKNPHKVVISTRYYLGDQVQVYEMGGTEHCTMKICLVEFTLWALLITNLKMKRVDENSL